MSFVSFWPTNNLPELADGPTLHVRWQEQDVCLLTFANLLSLSLYKNLAPNPPFENFTGQKLTNDLYKVSLARLQIL